MPPIRRWSRRATPRAKKALLDLLLEATTSLDAFDASALGRTELVREILSTHPALAKAWAGDGFRALHLACFFGHADAARLLLDGGAEGTPSPEIP